MRTKFNSFLVNNSVFFSTKYVQYSGKLQNTQIFKLIVNASWWLHYDSANTEMKKYLKRLKTRGLSLS